jgi:ribosomal protein L37AE/L43A
LCTTHKRQIKTRGEVWLVEKWVKPPTCEGPECDREPRLRIKESGIWLCNSHRMQLANGKPLTPIGSTVHRAPARPERLARESDKDLALRQMVVTPELIGRFWSKVDVRGRDECWEWKASLTASGYGQFSLRFKGKSVPVPAHRVARRFTEDVSGKWVLHSCDNPPCVNPQHLRVGTSSDNNSDMVKRDRHVYGSRNPVAKVSEEQVSEIKARIRAGEQFTVIAEDYPISAAGIGHIAAGRSWRHVE